MRHTSAVEPPAVTIWEPQHALPGNLTPCFQTRGATTLSVSLQVAQGLFPRHPLLFTYMILQVEDSPTTDLVRYFPKCFDFIDTAISKGGERRDWITLAPGGGGGVCAFPD